MRWLAAVALVFALRVHAAEPGAIVVLTRAGDAAAEKLLVDSLRIYTRDLGRTVRLGGAAPDSPAPDALARLAAEARSDGNDVVVWFGERDGAPLLFALVVATSDLRETRAESEPLDGARTLALKLRALLTPSTAPAAATDWTTPPAATPAATPPAATTPAAKVNAETPPAPAASTPIAAPVVAAPSPAPTAAPPPSSPASAAPLTVTRAPLKKRASILDISAAYVITVPTEPAWTRQGLLLRIAAPWGRLPLAAFVDAAFTNAPSVTVDTSAVASRVWPVGAGVELRLSRPRFSLAAGPRVSLQILQTSARAGDGRSGSATTFSAGVGAVAEGAWLFSRWVGAIASVAGEALLPRQQFLAGAGSATADLGAAQFTFSAGLVVNIP